MKKGKTLFRVVALFVGITALLYFLRQQTETRGDRVRISERCNELLHRLKQDPSDEKALTELIEILDNFRTSFGRGNAAVALRKLGPIAQRATPDLIRALDSGDPFLEREAALALGPVSAGKSDAVPALIAKLHDHEDDAAWFSAESLGEIGEPAVVAIPNLREAARSSNEQMARRAAFALEQLEAIQREKQARDREDNSDEPNESEKTRAAQPIQLPR